MVATLLTCVHQDLSGGWAVPRPAIGA